jgi:predicted Zn-dependent protease
LPLAGQPVRGMPRTPHDRLATVHFAAAFQPTDLPSPLILARPCQPSTDYCRANERLYLLPLPALPESSEQSLCETPYCLLGLASVAMQLRDPATAALNINRARELLGATPPTPLLLRLTTIQARMDLADGRFDEARTQFAQILDRKRKTPAMLEASLGKAEAELGSGKIDDAVNEGKAALKMATSLQGNQPYSNNTGLSWLMLGRALRKQGRGAEAHEAFAAAITHLSNTVEDDHPRLIQARDLASGTGGGIQY